MRHWRFQRFQQIQLLCVTSQFYRCLRGRILSGSTNKMSLSRAPSVRGVTGGKAHHSGAGRQRDGVDTWNVAAGMAKSLVSLIVLLMQSEVTSQLYAWEALI